MQIVYPLNPFIHLPDCGENYDEAARGDIPCTDLHTKVIALRVYFCLIIINFFFITLTTAYFIYRILSAKWCTPPIDMTSTTNQNVSKQWQIYSLKKRSLFGAVLGAVGHLLFSTSVLLYQVIVTNFTCDIYLWGPMVGFYIWTYAIIWRTIRLHLLIRVNELQQKYLVRNTASYNSNGEKIITDPNDASTSNGDADYIWFMRHKDTLNLSIIHHLSIFGASMLLIILIIILAECLGIWVGGVSRCQYYMGNYMVLGMIIFFFLAVVPFIVWYLRCDDDAHGIRQELWYTMAFGVPCFIMCIVWQALFDDPTASKPAGTRGVFSPSNWVVIVTTANHVMSIIMPVFKKLSINEGKRKSSSGMTNKRNSRRRSSNISNHIVSMLHAKHHHQNDSSTTLHSSIATSEQYWELTTESLHHALCDPARLTVLKNWAVKDFSVENVLFYDRYLNLVHQIDRALIRRSRQLSSKKHGQDGDLNDEVLALPASQKNKVHRPDSIPCNRENILSEAPTLSKPTEEILSIPFSSDQIPELVDFYNTFIADQSPLQVNISFRARNTLDSILGPLSKRFQSNSTTSENSSTTLSSIPYFLQPSIVNTNERKELFRTVSLNPRLKGESYELLSTSKSATPNTEVITVDEKLKDVTKTPSMKKNALSLSNSINTRGNVSSPATTDLTLQIFEQARKEVFWNIFSGLFPKIVEAYNNHSID